MTTLLELLLTIFALYVGIMLVATFIGMSVFVYFTVKERNK